MKNASEMKINLKPKKSWGNSFPGVEIKKSVKEEDILEAKSSKISVKIFDKIAIFSIAMLFLGIPLFFTNLTFQGIVFEKQLFFYLWLFIGLIAWTAKGIVLGEMKIKKTALDLPILIFWLVYLLATIFSVDKWHSFWGLFGDPSRGFVGITALIIAYYLIRSYFTIARFKIFIGSLIFSGGIVAVWILINVLRLDIFSEKFYSSFPVSLVGSALDSGIFLTMLIPIIVVAIFKVKDSQRISQYLKISTIIALAVELFVIMLALILASSSAPWVGVLIGMGFLLVFLVSRIVAIRSNLLWLPMVLFVIVFAVLMIGKINPVLNFFNVNVVELPYTVYPDNRLSYEVAKDSIKNNFILGSGPATYGYAFSKYKPQSYNLDQLYNLRHSEGRGIFFEYATTIGLLGLIAFLVLTLSFISVAFYLLIKNKERNKLYSLGIFSSVLVLLIDAAIYPLRGTILILGVLIGALALGIIFKESESEEGNLKLSLKASPKYALALAFIFMVICAGVTFAFVFLGKIYIADIYAGQALRENKISENGSINKLKKAIELYPKEARYFSRIGQEYMFLANQEVLKPEQEKDINIIRGYINSAIEYADKGRQISPQDVSMVENLAQIYENTGYFVPNSLMKSEEYYNQAIALEPHNPIYFVKLGQIKLGNLAGKKEEAERTQVWEEANKLFERAVTEKPDYDLGYYNLALAKSALKDLDGAISAMEKAFMINPRILEYRSGLGQLYTERGKDDDYISAEEIFLGIQNVLKDNIGNLANLGYLYEKMDRRDDAIAQYEKIIALLPEDNKEAKTKINRMISNIRNGIENTPENLKEQVLPPVQVEESSMPTPENLQNPNTSISVPPIPPVDESLPIPVEDSQKKSN